MASIVNYVTVPCLLGPTLVATNQVDSAAFFRTIRPQPLSLASPLDAVGLPTGPQLWPVKL